jgi:hypothetical protein
VIVVLVVVFGPVVIAYVPRRFARLRPFRWLLATPQPSASLDADGVDLCTPEDGCRRFAWEEIASLEPDPAWLYGSFVEGWPTVDLKAPDGRVLFRVPANLYGRLSPVGSRWHSGPRTLAEHIVVTRPDRFTFLEQTHLPPHYWFPARGARGRRSGILDGSANDHRLDPLVALVRGGRHVSKTTATATGRDVTSVGRRASCASRRRAVELCPQRVSVTPRSRGRKGKLNIDELGWCAAAAHGARCGSALSGPHSR